MRNNLLYRQNKQNQKMELQGNGGKDQKVAIRKKYKITNRINHLALNHPNKVLKVPKRLMRNRKDLTH